MIRYQTPTPKDREWIIKKLMEEQTVRDAIRRTAIRFIIAYDGNTTPKRRDNHLFEGAVRIGYFTRYLHIKCGGVYDGIRGIVQDVIISEAKRLRSLASKLEAEYNAPHEDDTRTTP